MNKLTHAAKNNILLFKYYFKFAPMGFLFPLFFCVLVAAVDTLSGPIALKYIFNGISGDKTLSEIIRFLLLVGAAMFLRHVCGAITEWISTTSRIKVRAGIQRIIFEQARKMDLEYYETPKFYNDFVWASSISDQEIISAFGSLQVFVARLSEILCLGGFVLLVDYNLLFIAAAIIIVRIIFEKAIIKKQYEMDLEAKPLERRRDYTSRVFYLADYAKELRLSDMHKTLFERLQKTMSKLRNIYSEGGKKLMVYELISSISASGFLDFCMYFYLCYQTIVTKVLMFGDLAGLVSAVNGITWRVQSFIDVFVRFSKHSLYIDNFREFMKYKPKIETSSGAEPPNDVSEICLKNVSFKYTGEKKYSLKNINLTIKPYEKIAIVGYNGAGKSTLAKLLLRFYDVTEGEITLGSQNIKDFDTDKYRENFGSVFQDYKIFAGTIAENVVMGFYDEKEKNHITDSLDKSGFSSKLRVLPNGIETQVTREFNERGINFSGGEEQKIAIARIFYKNCGYVILDEPSSALDPISEYNLNETMMSLSENKTVIFISHRLSTTCMADRILMMENGEIIEQGSHDELMHLNGKYAEMFKLQAEKYKI